MHKSPRQRRKANDDGVVAIEFVLAAPFLIALVFAIAHFGLFFSEKVEVNSAARDAARTLALRGTVNWSDPMFSGMTPSAIVTCAVGDTTSNASVTLTENYVFSIPLIPLGTKSIVVTQKMRCGG